MTESAEQPPLDVDSDPTAQVDPYRGALSELTDYLDLVLLCLQRHVARHGHRMLEESGQLNDLYVSFEEARALLRGSSQFVPAEALVRREGWPTAEEIEGEIAAQQARIKGRLALGTDEDDPAPLPIEELRANFRLSERQIRLLVAAAAPLISTDVARLYTFSWADFGVKMPTVGFLAELMADRPDEVTALTGEFHADSPLVRYQLLRLGNSERWGVPSPLFHRCVTVPDELVAYLEGFDVRLPRELASTCELLEGGVEVSRDELVLADETTRELTTCLRRAMRDRRGRPRLLLVGSPSSGRRTVLSTYMVETGFGLLTVDLDLLAQEESDFEGLLRLVCREAMLHRCAILFRGDEFFKTQDNLLKMLRPLGRVVDDYVGLVAFSAREPVSLLHRYVDGLVDIPFPFPSAEQQEDLWRRAFEAQDSRVAPALPQQLARRFNLPAGAIFRSVEDARSKAILHGGSRHGVYLRAEDLSGHIRQNLDHMLSHLAEVVSTTLDWDDVVLPHETVDTLREIVSHTRHRQLVYHQWGFLRKLSYGRGLSCLFSGPPGTGKTMMAGIIAKDLGLELYRVDLSRIASKWVGETEKNLARLFDEAERAQVILLFDEADSLFSSRTAVDSANDRFANMEINYLLQRMEAYDGTTILTTNFERGIDEAFKRRMKFRVTFPMPTADLRTQLWTKMIPDLSLLAEGVDFAKLGKQFEMSGGNIRNAVLRAAFYAAEEGTLITHAHLHRAGLAEAREMGQLVRG